MTQHYPYRNRYAQTLNLWITSWCPFCNGKFAIIGDSRIWPPAMRCPHCKETFYLSAEKLGAA